MDAVQIGVSQRTVFRWTASQINNVSPARHQLDREPVPVARDSDLARRRVADRHPARRGDVFREIAARVIRLRHARQRLRNRVLDNGLLLDIGDVDGDRHIGMQPAIARPHREFVAGPVGLVVGKR